MLVLTRREGQSIQIGDGVEVFVVEVRGNQVRLGFRAAPDVVIDRSEVRAAKEAEGRDASTPSGGIPRA